MRCFTSLSQNHLWSLITLVVSWLRWQDNDIVPVGWSLQSIRKRFGNKCMATSIGYIECNAQRIRQLKRTILSKHIKWNFFRFPTQPLSFSNVNDDVFITPIYEEDGDSRRRAKHQFSNEDLSQHNASSNELDNVYVELIEPETNCTVRIVGVFHGTQSSSLDVANLIMSSSTNMIVLELCPDRYKDLILKEKRPNTHNNNSSYCNQEEQEQGTLVLQKDAKPYYKLSSRKSSSWFENYYLTVKGTVTLQGWRSGLVVAIFGLVNGFQQNVLKLQPGLEFTTAADFGNKLNIPIVLADQDVTITLQRISEIPRVSFDMWYRFYRTRSWDESFGSSSRSFWFAIFGGWMKNDSYPKLLTLPKFLTRNVDAVQDLLKVIGIPLLFVQLLNEILSKHYRIDPSSVSPDLMTIEVLDGWVTSIVNVIVVILFYLSVALPATQVILIERDDVLSAGIQAACRLSKVAPYFRDITFDEEDFDKVNLVTTHTRDNVHKTNVASDEVMVIVVVGFLHVNGVALRLIKK